MDVKDTKDTGVIRTVAIIAAIIIVAGLVIIGSQYWGTITGGAGAALIDFEKLPDTLTISQDTYRQMVDVTDEYFTHTDMASRNELVRQLQQLLISIS